MTYLQKKRLAFMSIVNSVKGFVRSVLGIPPLTLPDCVDEDSLINYTISGNSVQNGTPTPENPVEVESVGDKTVNLFDMRNVILINGYISVNKTIVSSEKTNTFYIPCKPNTAYTFSRQQIKVEGQIFRIGYGTSIPGLSTHNDTTATLTNIASNVSGLEVSITTNDSAKYLFVCEGEVTVDDVEYVKGFQLQEGTTATDYEPYGKYKIPVVCSGKNLFDSSKYWNIYATDVADGYSGYNVTKIDGGVKIARNSSAGWSNDIVGLEPNTTYTVSFKAKTAQGGTNYIVISVDKKLYYKYMYAATTSTLTQTFTTDGSPSAFGFAHSNFTLSSGTASTLEITDIMLVKGSTVTDYEPYVKPVTTNIYLDKPLAEGETLKNPVKLPTVKGTTIYTIGTGVQPKNMSATYYSTRKD